jgi:HD-like signal output (HDOD) protein
MLPTEASVIDPSQLSMPTVSGEGLKVLRMLEDEDVDMHALVGTIVLDPVLSSTLIKYANSPAHRRARDATSVQQAVNVLGTRQVRGAAMIAVMRGFSSGNDPITAMLWDQSVVASTLARAVARRSCLRLADEAELVGLLHNMGALVLNTNYRELYRSLADSVIQDRMLVHTAEREVFGLHRGDLIEPLATSFRLPRRTVEVLLAYHAGQLPAECVSDEQRLLGILWVAQTAAWRSRAAANWLPEFLPADIGVLMDQLGLTEEDVLDLSEDVELLVAERMGNG